MHRYRTLFISDVHLGSPDSQSELLKEFLEQVECETLYLVGDIFDLWKMKYRLHWSPATNDVLQVIFQMAQRGIRVVYIPGNHDEMARAYCGLSISGIEILEQDVHTTLEGNRLLILHGDCFDEFVREVSKLHLIGSALYEVIMIISRYHNRLRRSMRYSYWSFAAFIKYRFKEAVRYIQSYETAALDHADAQGYDGIVCGHIHHPNRIDRNGTLYLNTGDWVEHCSAVGETADGQLTEIDWLKERQQDLPLHVVPVSSGLVTPIRASDVRTGRAA
tara:strand:+ start:93 stop:920 length:828 start_codon:yes stop_codon:yes gene_type:complete